MCDSFDDLVYPNIPFSIGVVGKDDSLDDSRIFGSLGLEPNEVTGDVLIVEAYSSTTELDDIKFYIFVGLDKIVVKNRRKYLYTNFNVYDMPSLISNFIWSYIAEYGDLNYNIDKYTSIDYPYNIDSYDESSYPNIPFSVEKVGVSDKLDVPRIYDCLGLEPSDVSGNVLVVEAYSSTTELDDIVFYIFIGLGKIVVKNRRKYFYTNFTLHETSNLLSEFIWDYIKEYGDLNYNIEKYTSIAYPYSIDLI